MNNQFKSPHVDDLKNFSNLLERTNIAMTKFMNERNSMPVDCSVPPKSILQKLSNFPIPAKGISADDILSLVEEDIMPWAMPTSHARSYGWVNSPAAPVATLCEALMTAMKNGLDGGDTPSKHLMVSLGRWLMELSGFVDEKGTPDGMAILLAGGSAANLNGLTVARHWAAKRDGYSIREEGLQGNRPAMIYYTSAQSHSSVQLCVEQLGIGTSNLRIIETDNAFRMRPEALRESINKDLAAGLRPSCVVGSCGSTNVGAIDPLDEIADVCEEYNLWFHVDGAYGGIVGLDPAYEEMTRALNRVDSLTLDPHKWLQVPLDCGALLIRDRYLNFNYYNLVPDYLSEASAEESSAPSPCDHMFELTFADRCVKTWAAIARIGFEGVRDMVINCNNMARLLGELVEKSDDLELLSPVSASTLNFRYLATDKTMSNEALNILNQQLSDDITDSGEAHIPTTKVNGLVSLRACFLHYANSEEDVYHLVTLVQHTGAKYN
ncbi:MAG: aminotransferase class I/II-fold pyridoxal phosphate-dependent enzyme [Pseudomonadales bacterium]